MTVKSLVVDTMSRVALAFVLCLTVGIQPGRAAADIGSPSQFDIPPQQLPSALLKFSEQSGVTVTSPGDIVEGRQSPGVLGTFDARTALDRILKGTQLAYDVVDRNTVLITKPRGPAGAAAAAEATGGAGSPPAIDPKEAQKSSFWDRFRLAQAAAGNAVAPQSAAAANTDDSSSPVTLQEVIVTAQKREQRLFDVPMSIAAVTAEDIDRRGLVSAEDYLRGVPGVSQVTDATFGGAIVIRGIETTPRAQNFQSGSTVATYFGETPTTSSAGLTGGSNVDLKLVDIERVEVLRGPQGTAFGNASLGGAVRTIPVSPKLNTTEARVAASYSFTSGDGSGNSMVQAVANLPLVADRLSIRVVGYRFEDSGFYRNTAGSNPTVQARAASLGGLAFATNASDVGAAEFTGGRFAAFLQATDNLKFTLSYLKQNTQIDGQPFATTGTYEQAVFQVAPEHVIRGETGGASDTDIDLANATAEYEFGWANLLATFSHVESGSDASLTYAPYTSPYGELGTSAHNENSGEIRLATHFDGAWNVLGGVYAEDLKDRGYFNDVWYGSPASNPFGAQRLLGDELDRRDQKQKAAFAEVSWEFLRGLTLTGGARVYDYTRNRAVANTGYFGASVVTPEANKSGSTFRGNLSYKPTDDALLYADWSQGFRLGRPQTGVPTSACDINGDGIVDGTGITVDQTKLLNSDEVSNYELGTKLALIDRRLEIAADVYRIEWTGVPFQVRLPCNRSYLANAGGARSEGVELQASVRAAAPLRVDFGASWLRARLTDDVPTLNGFVARSGERLPGSPKFNANLALQYEFNIGSYAAFVRADSTYVGTFYGDIHSLPDTRSGGYTKLDVTARVTINHLNVDLFGRNLTGADDYTFRGIFAGQGQFFGYRLRPRTIGVQLGYSF